MKRILMTIKKILLIIGLLLFTKAGFSQKKYEVPIHMLFFYYDSPDTILKKISDKYSDFKLCYFNKHEGSVQIYSTTKPFPNDFFADSCTIFRSKDVYKHDLRLSDSLPYFNYAIEYCYKSRSQAKKDLRYLCKQFDLLPPKTKDGIDKTVYFELDNDLPVCISHDLHITKLEKNARGIYLFKLVFICHGDRDINRL